MPPGLPAGLWVAQNPQTQNWAVTAEQTPPRMMAQGHQGQWREALVGARRAPGQTVGTWKGRAQACEPQGLRIIILVAWDLQHYLVAETVVPSVY